MMPRTVDVVILGGSPTATAAALDAVGRGQRVLVVTRSRRSGVARSLRQAIGAAGGPALRQLTVLTRAEIACVDGVRSVEAVVVRQLRTGRLVGFNASTLLDFRTPARKPGRAEIQR